jgi:hypothetical protein
MYSRNYRNCSAKPLYKIYKNYVLLGLKVYPVFAISDSRGTAMISTRRTQLRPFELGGYARRL